jgi:iduronate 2-sulfatase
VSCALYRFFLDLRLVSGHLNIMHSCSFLVVLLSYVWLSVARAAEPAGTTNVLLICVDDLKPLLGCYGAQVKSPHIDRLAARSVRFDAAYANQAVCAPSRNSLMTGRRPTSLGIYDLGTFFRASAPEAITLAQLFKQHGWRTEALGKIFHVGHGNHDDPASWSVPHWSPRAAQYALPKSFPGKDQEKSEFPKGAAVECADVPDLTYGDGQIADEAIRRLQAAAKDPNQPFFLAVGFLKPHLPFVAPKKYWDLYQRGSFQLPRVQQPPDGAPAFAPTTWAELRNYSDIPDTGPLSADRQLELIHGYHAAVSYMDAQLGRVLSELNRLKLDQNTIVVFWGDHGWHLGDHGMWCKHTNYEEATRIPVLVRAPGVSKPGASRSLIETVDIYPTLCDLAGLPKSASLDGESFLNALKDPAAGKTKEAVFHVYPRSPKGQGDLLGRAVRTERYRLVEWKRPGAPADTAILELYDYLEDPQETRNLASSRPEAVARLRETLSRQPEGKPQIRAAEKGTKKKGAKRGA